jgi:translation initiation factor IF-2
MKRNTLTTILALSMVLAACSDPVADSADELCGNLEDLNDTVEQVAGAEASVDTVTVEQVQDAAGEVESAVQDVQEAESDLSDSLKAQLRDDLEALQSSIQDIPADSTLAEVGEDVRAALTAFYQSWSQTLSELNCSVEG